MKRRLLMRLSLPVILTSLLLLAVGAGAAWYVQRLQKATSHLLAENVASVRAALQLELTLRQVRGRLDRFRLTGDRRYLQDVPQLKQDADRWLTQAQQVAITEREQAWMGKIRPGFDRFFVELKPLIGEGPSPPLPDAVYSLTDEVLNEEVLRPLDAYLAYNEDQVQRASLENQQQADRLVIGLLILGTCGAAAGLVMGLGLAVALRRSVVQIQVGLRDAAGKLTEVVGTPVSVSGLDGDLFDLEHAVRQLSEPVAALVEHLHNSRREAMRSEQLAAVGQMAAGIAHEVRNPLTAMKVLVQAAADRGDRSPLRSRDLRVLEEEIGRLEKLIDTFLNFARPPRPDRHWLDLREVASQVVDLLSGQAEIRGVTLRTILPPGPLGVEADRGQMQQLLFNLLLNAIEASPEHGIVSLRLEMSGGRNVLARVRDQGPGLPGGLETRIFEPFVSTKETGLGLGLSICRHIVEAHGGVLAAINRPTGGAEFTASLPAAGVAEADSRNPPRSMARVGGGE